MGRTVTCLLASGLLALSLCGCGTISTMASGVREPYSGTRLNAFVFGSPSSTSAEKLGAVIDYPFSLVADVALVAFMNPSGPADLVSPKEH